MAEITSDHKNGVNLHEDFFNGGFYTIPKFMVTTPGMF